MSHQGKSDMENFLSLAKAIAKNADEADRKKVLDTLRDVAYSIESPEDTIQRIMFSNLQLASARIGVDLKLFETLTKSGEPMTVEQLAASTGASPLLLGRLLRYLASIAMIKETAKDVFAATNITQTLSIPGFQGGIYHYFDSFGPAFQALPDFLKETKYADITENTNTPLQKAWNTTQPAFIWVQTKPENFAHFNHWMAAQRHGMPTWLDVYPVEEMAPSLGPEEPLFVDVGGGLGHQCIALRERFPHLKGRVILQDIPQTLTHAIHHDKVEIMVQDFFQPQAIKGATFYYMRNILHDYPDKQCRMILQNTIAAMRKGSVILVDDMVLPNSGIHWQATQLDMAMMTGMAAVERTKEQWYALLEGAGLKINKIWTYTTSLQDSIIEAVLPQ